MQAMIRQPSTQRYRLALLVLDLCRTDLRTGRSSNDIHLLRYCNDVSGWKRSLNTSAYAHIALIEEMSKPNNPPPIMAMAAMRYTFPNFFTMLADWDVVVKIQPCVENVLSPKTGEGKGSGRR